MSPHNHANMTKENLALKRGDIMTFLNSDVDPVTKKTRKTPDLLRTALTLGGHDAVEIDKVIGDWNSYV